MKSLLTHQFTDISEEIFDTLVLRDNFLLERIISNGHLTPDGQWLCQERTELVVLLKGSASLRFQDSELLLDMYPGDYVIINSGQLHRVEKCTAEEETIWLALHYDK